VVVLYFLALERIPAGEAGMLYNLFPVVATAMSVAAFGERPTVHLALALVVATAGVALVLGDGSLRIGLGAGEVLALAAAVFAAFTSVTIRAMRATDNAAPSSSTSAWAASRWRSPSRSARGPPTPAPGPWRA
jgi:drug/metabolite transporter (DMT)-like permease